MFAELENHLRACWPRLSPGKRVPEQIRFLKWSGEDYAPPTAAFLFLAFADREAKPVAVIKSARIAAADATIRAEVAQLEIVRSRVPEDLARVIPEPIVVGTVNERAFFLSASLPGEMEPHHTWTFERVRERAGTIRAALRWAGRLAETQSREAVTLGRWLGIESDDAVLQALREHSWNEEELHRFEPQLAELWRASWPGGIAHGDYWSGNLLFTGSSISGVVDWALASDHVPIFADVLTYEITFTLNALYEGGRVDREHSDAIHALQPFVEARAWLGDFGIDAGPESLARLATLLAGSLGHRGIWKARAKIARAYSDLLRAQLGIEPSRR